MANADAWNAGWALGAGRAQEDRAHKQALKDQELETKINEVQGNIGNLQTKLSTLDPSSPDYATAKQSLQDAIQSRNDLFHPANNPNALQKFGHLLRVSKGPQPQSVTTTPSAIQLPALSSAPIDIASSPAYTPASLPSQRKTVPGVESTTLPSTPETPPSLPASAPVTVKGPALTPQQLKSEAQARMETNQLVSAAPLSPQQQAEIQAKAGIAGDEAKANWQLDFAKRHNLSPEAVQELTEKIAGVPTVKVPKPIGVPFRDANDGKWYQRTQDPLTGAFSQVEVPGYSQTARPSSGAFNQYVDAYARDHGVTADQLPQSARDYLRQKWALDAAVSTSTETNTLKEDFKGDWRPITEVNTRTPSAARQLVDPLASSNRAASSIGRGGQTPQQVRKQASSRSGEGASPNSRVRIGDPVFAGKNKEYDDQQASYDGAVKRANKMHDSLVKAEKGSQQDMLNLVANHIGMTLGAQKGARINQAVWNEAVASRKWLEGQIASSFHQDPQTGDYIFDGWKTGVNLTNDQMEQMCDLADASVKAEKESLDTIKNRLEHPNASSGKSDGDQTKKHKIKIGDKFYTYKGTGDTADLGSYDEVKQ